MMAIEYLVRTTLKTMVNPLCLVLFILLAALLWLWIKGNTRVTRGLIMGALIGLSLMSTGFLPYHMLYPLEHQYERVKQVDANIHWVVVFGGGQYEKTHAPANHVLFSSSIMRLLEGVRLYRQLPQAKLLLSGGSQKKNVTTEAEHMAEIVSWFGISKSDVEIESRSKNTMDEALYIKHWTHDEPFYLVTSASHMKRAIALCKYQGLHPIPAPTDYLYQKEDGRWQKALLPSPKHIVRSSIVFYETLGLGWAILLRKI